MVFKDDSSSSVNKEYVLKVLVPETELLSALRQVASPLGTAAERKGRVRRSVRKGMVIGWYFPRSGVFTFVGILHRSYAISFRLRPGSKTYLSFLEALRREIIRDSTVNTFSHSKELSSAVRSIADALEKTCANLNVDKDQGSYFDIIDVHPEDFEIFESEIPAEAKEELLVSGSSAEVPLVPMDVPLSELSVRRVVDTSKAFRVFDRSLAEFATLTGLISIELETIGSLAAQRVYPIAESSEDIVEADLSEKLPQFSSRPRVTVTPLGVEVIAKVEISDKQLKYTDLYIHWGRYQSSSSELWIDDEVAPHELSRDSRGICTIRKMLHPSTEGNYGLTCWLRNKKTKEKTWQGRALIDDTRFVLGSDYSLMWKGGREVLQTSSEHDIQDLIIEGMASFEQFVRVINEILESSNGRSLRKLLFDMTSADSKLRAKLCEYHKQSLKTLKQSKSVAEKNKLESVRGVLENIGVGEIVFVAPEGPHAIAGGLAQVVIGLSKSLDGLGVGVTVIAPLYEKAQGRKHKSAEVLIREGLQFNDVTVKLTEIGEVSIPFGPTNHSGSKRVREFPRVVRSRVYYGESGHVRFFFLRHKKLASQLYANVASDEQLRRAIFLSRGALELLRDRTFAINPHIVITNDWVSGLIHAFLKTDPIYRKDALLADLHTVHVLHNCGRAYQGLMYVNQYGEDLWPLLGLPDEHFFGICDPHDQDFFNPTAAAIFHVEKALLAVSKPYAEQLMTEAGGEGLDELVRSKAEIVYGISNGIDLAALRLVCWQLGENARDSLGFKPLAPEKFTESRLLKRLGTYKEAAKLVVQRANGLIEDPNALLISFVGRLAEQKGTALLVEDVEESRASVIETVLERYPEVQLLVGGPPSKNDSTVDMLIAELSRLTKIYPGRIQGLLDFIPHAEVIEIALASSLFLMPSRYEPGGIAQLEALATGTPVVARNVGGLSATLVEYDPESETGTSFLFDDYTGDALFAAMTRALQVCKNKKRQKNLVDATAMEMHDWNDRTSQYIALLQNVCGVWNGKNRYPYLKGNYSTLEAIRAELSL